MSRFVAGLKLKGWDHHVHQQHCELSSAVPAAHRSSGHVLCTQKPADVILIWLHPPPRQEQSACAGICPCAVFLGDCVVRVGSGAWWIVLKGVKLLKSYRVKSPGMEEHDGGSSPPSTSSLSVLDYVLKGFLRFRALCLLCCYLLFGCKRTCRLILNIQTGAVWGSIVVTCNIPSSRMDSVSILTTRKMYLSHPKKKKVTFMFSTLDLV